MKQKTGKHTIQGEMVSYIKDHKKEITLIASKT